MKKNSLAVMASVALLSVGSIVTCNTTPANAKTVKTEKVSAKPEVIYINHTEKGITYKLKVAKKATVSFSYKGKTVLTKKAKTTKLKVFISAKELKDKKGSFEVRQKELGKKISRAVKAKIIKVGLVEAKII